jgi:iron(III) transport system substrate-binding protein
MTFSKLTFSTLVAGLALATPAAANEVVNVYSYRQPALIEPLVESFQKMSGIEVKVVFSDKGLIERMEQEGTLSPVDVLLTTDAGQLVSATSKGLAQPVISDTIDNKVPANLRDPDHNWFGLTMRARVVYASRDRVAQDHISYEELADPKWKGKVCMRPADHPYNLALVAAVITERGEEFARIWLDGVSANLAVRPNGNDRAQAKSVFAGECDLGIGNTYYVGLMAHNDKEPEQKDWANAIRVLMPSSDKMGTHVNISGMLMAKSAPNFANARAFMEYLASDEAQKLYAGQNYEYPVNPAVPADDFVQSLGTLSPSSVNLKAMVANEAKAAKMISESAISQ